MHDLYMCVYVFGAIYLKSIFSSLPKEQKKKKYKNKNQFHHFAGLIQIIKPKLQLQIEYVFLSVAESTNERKRTISCYKFLRNILLLK